MKDGFVRNGSQRLAALTGLLRYLREYSLRELIGLVRDYIFISSSGLFDSGYYRLMHAGLRKEPAAPLLNFMRHGWKEGSDPSLYFDTKFYLQRYPDVRAAEVNPLLHYIRSGKPQGRDPSPTPGLRPIAIKSRLTRRGWPAWPAAFGNRIRNVVRGAASLRFSRKITFFFFEESQFLVLEPVAAEARARGYDVAFSTDKRAPAEVGFYSKHSPEPTNSRFSVVMLHDLGQDQWPECPSREPNHWILSPWNAFDIGILPGRAWSQCWYSVSTQPSARPRLGVFELGWPKADRVFRDRRVFDRDVRRLRRKLGMMEGSSVLYAPSWEYGGKQDDLVRALAGMPVNILIKRTADQDDDSHDRLRGIVESYGSRARAKVHYIDPKMNIMHCLALADVVVSDESSCLVEALLFEIPGIAVTDWLIPDPGSGSQARFPDPPPCAVRTDRASLAGAVERVLGDRRELLPVLRRHRDRYFSNLGRSSRTIMDVVDSALIGAPWPVEPLRPKWVRHGDSADHEVPFPGGAGGRSPG